MEVKQLCEFKEKQLCRIVKLSGSVHLKRRLLDLGFTSGSFVKIVSISPLKNSFLLEIHGYIIALRKNAVKNIFVVKVEV